ncbi:MAG: hypothetical protein ABI577_01865 [bacterium]
MRATVAVVTAPGHPTLLTQSRYLVRHVADYWREHDVAFELTTDPSNAPVADLAWQHLDATSVDPAYRRLLARYPVTINGKALDISKRIVASHLVLPGDDWRGPVIIKTNRNFGGRAEDWIHRWRVLHHPWLHALQDALPTRLSGRIDPATYPIHTSKAGVPNWVWNDRRFVVQRFIAERQGELYGIRRLFVLGDREFAYLAYGPKPIVQGDDNGEWTRLRELPDALRRFRSEIGLDCGKIDYCEVDGELVVYDVNPAVSADGPEDLDLQRQIVAELTPGLETFLRAAGR